jgi:hypothetical protein
MNDTILLVFKGEIIEEQVFKSIESIFFPSSNGQQIIRSSFKAEIYQLWQEIKDDADLDIVESSSKDLIQILKTLIGEMCQKYISFSIMTVIPIQIQCPHKITMK